MKTISFLAILVIVAGAIFYVTHGGLDGGGESSKEEQAPPPEVTFVVVQPEAVTLTTELPGRISAYLVAEVRPQVNGIIQERLFTEGSDVEEGQILYQIDPALFEASAHNAEANLVGAQKAVKEARAALEASIAYVKQQQATLDLALKNRHRFETLAANGTVPLSERDRAVAEAEVAEAALKSAEAQVRRNEEGIPQAEAAVKQAEAALETARINLAYTRITAPISGRIGISNVTVGALVTAHQPLALTTIQQLDPIYVDVTQSTKDLLRLRHRLEEGQIAREETNINKAQLILEDGSTYSHEGTMQFQDVTVNESTGSVIVRIVFPNPDRILLPGMFVRAALIEGTNEQAILIPQQAVSRDTKGNPLAMVVDQDEKTEQRQLTVDRAIGNRWLVTSGLKAGDRVIVEGLQMVRPRTAVKAAPFEADQPGDATSGITTEPASESN
ncbi:MAG TPA: efflux RND transporter periplasmic adaptor subunit [bacterium]|nr:efflux RND transporter periplasmic adaptor subunit [bacterium]HQL61854.1 efflux RND transporter periplasmic adaptor subunit [bacterium]